MGVFTFVHAADLHLDAPFKGLRSLAAEPARRLPQAGFVALERLVEICLKERAHSLFLAGDVYNAKEGSLRARLALRDVCLRLQTAGVRVFLAHGNHDPLSSDVAVPLPNNVTVFGSEPEVHRLESPEHPPVLVAGIGHSREKESRNLAALFPALPGGAFRVGVLHCALAGFSGGHESYAPCSQEDLLAVGCDYWALGHVHARREVLPAGPYGPRLVYPGSMVGLHVRETGEHGCMLGRAGEAGCAVEFVPLAPVRWEAADIPLEDAGDTLPALESHILERLDAFRAGSPSDFPPAQVLLRLTLTGRTDLHRDLAAPQAAEDLRLRLNETLEGSGLWLRDLRTAPRPPLDLKALALREDLPAAVLRRAQEALVEGEARRAARAALDELFGRSRAAGLEAPDEAELDELILRARDLCLDLLEAGRCD